MKIQITHKKTGKVSTVQSDGTTLTIDGDTDLKNGLEENLGKYHRTLHREMQYNAAKNYFGEHLIKNDPASIASVDTAAFEFLTKFFIPDITKMGFECVLIDEDKEE